MFTLLMYLFGIGLQINSESDPTPYLKYRSHEGEKYNCSLTFCYSYIRPVSYHGPDHGATRGWPPLPDFPVTFLSPALDHFVCNKMDQCTSAYDKANDRCCNWQENCEMFTNLSWNHDYSVSPMFSP